MASANFTNLPLHLAKADIDFDTNTFKVLLVTVLPDETALDSWVYRSSVTNEVANGNGYATGGIAQAFTLSGTDTTNNRVSVTYTNITNGWTSATFSAVGAIIYQSTGNSATDRLLHMVDFGGTVSCSNGSFSVTYSAPFYINR